MADEDHTQLTPREQAPNEIAFALPPPTDPNAANHPYLDDPHDITPVPMIAPQEGVTWATPLGNPYRAQAGLGHRVDVIPADVDYLFEQGFKFLTADDAHDYGHSVRSTAEETTFETPQPQAQPETERGQNPKVKDGEAQYQPKADTHGRQETEREVTPASKTNVGTKSEKGTDPGKGSEGNVGTASNVGSDEGGVVKPHAANKGTDTSTDPGTSKK